MELNWDNAKDSARSRRLTIGYLVGSTIIGIGLVCLSYTAHGRVFEEENIEVALVPASALNLEIELEENTPAPQTKSRGKAKSRKTTYSPNSIPNNVPMESDSEIVSVDLEDAFENSAGINTLIIDKPNSPVKMVAENKPEKPIILIKEKIVPPIAIIKIAPRYPVIALQQKVTIIARFVVNIHGRTERIKIIKGHQLLNSAVLEALSAWRFKAGIIDGEPANMWHTVRFSFDI